MKGSSRQWQSAVAARANCQLPLPTASFFVRLSQINRRGTLYGCNIEPKISYDYAIGVQKKLVGLCRTDG